VERRKVEEFKLMGSIQTKIKKAAVWSVQRTAVLYALAVVVILLTVDVSLARYNMQLATLNRIKPLDNNYLIDFSKAEVELDKKKLKKYEHYYQKVSDYIDGRADALGLLGYCQFHLGKPEEAIKLYKKAIEINPHFFWFYYNLGVIYYKQGSFKEASAMFDRAIETDPEAVLVFIFNSKRIYLPLLASESGKPEKFLLRQVKSGFMDVFKGAVISHFQSKAYEKVLTAAFLGINTKADKTDFFYYYAGVAAIELGDVESGVTLLKEAVQRNPNNIDTYKYLAAGFKTAGHQEVASRLLMQKSVIEKAKQAQKTAQFDVELKLF